MVAGGITGYSHRGVLHYPRVSSSASLRCAHTVCFSLSSISLHLLVPLGGSQGFRVFGILSGVMA